MTELWDDRAIKVKQNTGKPVNKEHDKYAAKYDFDDLHPRHEQNKRFVEKHASLTLAQTIDRPATPGEKKTFDDYVEFLKVGGNKPLPFKDWLKFHRTTKYYQAQKDREDTAKDQPEDDGQEKLIGGKADYEPESDFDPDALSEGIQHEKEHTTSEEVASEIARDHLAEDPKYYKKLDEMEKSEPSRHRDIPSKHTLAAVCDFAASFYTAYYQDKEQSDE
jgi:hypothetical protein